MRHTFFFLVFMLVFLPLQAKPVEIVFWHSMAGPLGAEVKKLVTDFNNTQPDYVIKPVYKGDYLESLTSYAAAYQAKQPPALVQIFEVGTATMLAPKGIIKPVDELMREQGLTLPTASFFPVVRSTYSDHGHLAAMPFNISVPVIFYNADALAKLGFTDDSFPRTWDELEILAIKLRKAGFPCAYTTAYPAWVLLESFSAIHGLPMISSTSSKAVYNNKPVIHHFQRLLRWQHQHYFEYGGRTDDATTLFTSGRCPLFSGSSGGYSSLASLVSFKVGVGALPLDNHVSKKRFHNVAGGAALWVTAGQTPEIYQGISRFFVYLAQPAVQRDWHQRTGYLPLGLTGVYQQLTQDSKHPAMLLAQYELSGSDQGNMSKSLGIQNQIRLINDEALEVIFAGIKTPQDAMDDAVKSADHALIRFKRNTHIMKE